MRRVARFIAQLTAKGQEKEIPALKQYLDALRQEREAEFVGDDDEVRRLMKLRMDLESEHPGMGPYLR